MKHVEDAGKAISILDKILPLLDPDAVFHFAEYAKDILKWSPEEFHELVSVNHYITHLALNKYKYVDEKTKNYYYQLNEKGIAAKNAGGHFAYLKKLEDKEIADNNRQALSDEKLSYDVKNAKRIFKTYWWTFWFAVIALFISLLLGFLKLKEQYQQAPAKKPASLTQLNVPR